MDRVKEFLHKNWDGKSPLLLGYSGGFDSKALLYLLLDLGIKPHLAHVDHGWREESRIEAEALKREAESLGLPFHTIRLEPDRRESAAREKRLEFFASLFQKIPFQALLLAHQKDDAAETALKRVLEGAHMVHLGGMRGVSQMGTLTIWRPLLEVPRVELKAYLASKNLQPIDDATNSDPAYLRARMRKKILPDLAENFGKAISHNLALLGRRAYEFRDYLDRKTDLALKKIQKGPWGLYLPVDLEEPIEVRHLLQRTQIPFSREILEGLTEALIRKLPQQKFGSRLIADRGNFFYLAEKMPLFQDPILVKKGVYRSGDWQVAVEAGPLPEKLDWEGIWQGNFSMALPEDSWIETPKKGYRKEVPPFLRPHFPIFSWRERGGLVVRFSIDSNNSSSMG
ncbi:MAG: tRNA lysidine(34) synthetase TilS [Verrucomicrobia bacterium]|nr:tRNA lysidine(34) synthetase TilS [Verrucomicrobiota bacterium]